MIRTHIYKYIDAARIFGLFKSLAQDDGKDQIKEQVFGTRLYRSEEVLLWG
jgi:hypothetical protein